MLSSLFQFFFQDSVDLLFVRNDLPTICGFTSLYPLTRYCESSHTETEENNSFGRNLLIYCSSYFQPSNEYKPTITDLMLSMFDLNSDSYSDSTDTDSEFPLVNPLNFVGFKLPPVNPMHFESLESHLNGQEPSTSSESLENPENFVSLKSQLLNEGHSISQESPVSQPQLADMECPIISEPTVTHQESVAVTDDNSTSKYPSPTTRETQTTSSPDSCSSFQNLERFLSTEEKISADNPFRSFSTTDSDLDDFVVV